MQLLASVQCQSGDRASELSFELLVWGVVSGKGRGSECVVRHVSLAEAEQALDLVQWFVLRWRVVGFLHRAY